MEYGKITYKPQHRGAVIELTWDGFYEDFIKQVRNGDHEDWLPPKSAARTIELGAMAYADSMIEWYLWVHDCMIDESGPEYEDVQAVLRDHGLIPKEVAR